MTDRKTTTPAIGGKTGRVLKIRVRPINGGRRYLGAVLAANNAQLAEGELRADQDAARADALRLALDL